MLGWLIDADIDSASLFAANNEVENKIQNLPKLYVSSRILLSSIPRSVELHLGLLANMNAARIAIATVRFRLVDGRSPENLSEFVPACTQDIPDDPFDNRIDQSYMWPYLNSGSPQCFLILLLDRRLLVMMDPRFLSSNTLTPIGRYSK